MGLQDAMIIPFVCGMDHDPANPSYIRGEEILRNRISTLETSKETHWEPRMTRLIISSKPITAIRTRIKDGGTFICRP